MNNLHNDRRTDNHLTTMNGTIASEKIEILIEKKIKMIGLTKIEKITARNNEGRKIGYAKINFNNCELFDLEVNKEFQRRGIGTKLFQESVNDLKLHDCTYMSWYATQNSVPFYYVQGADGGSNYLPSMGLLGMYIKL